MCRAVCVQAQTAHVFSRARHFKRRVDRWKQECYRNANAVAILDVTAMFCKGKLHISSILYAIHIV